MASASTPLNTPRSARLRRWFRASSLLVTALTIGAIAPLSQWSSATAQTPGQALTLRSDIQEANSITGVITARGNVQIDYPARQIQATSAQALYYSREQRIVLSGDVYVLQEGNSLRGETVTYLIEEGRFVALPDRGQQVQSIYIVPDENPEPVGSGAVAPEQSDFDPKTEILEPVE
ncbi:MAG TPA: LptA/OstA family protein [Candidatus Obscuribacterales bacterium]